MNWSGQNLYFLYQEAIASTRMARKDDEEGEGTVAIDGPVYIIKNDEQPETD
jgi:hypothetical protein